MERSQPTSRGHGRSPGEPALRMTPEAMSAFPGTRTAMPAPAAASHGAAAGDAVRFSVLIFLVSLLLQRFALPMGELPFSVVGPIGLLLGAFWVLRGTLALDQRRFVALLALAAIAFTGTLLSMAAATARLAAISWTYPRRLFRRRWCSSSSRAPTPSSPRCCSPSC